MVSMADIIGSYDAVRAVAVAKRREYHRISSKNDGLRSSQSSRALEILEGTNSCLGSPSCFTAATKTHPHMWCHRCERTLQLRPGTMPGFSVQERFELSRSLQFASNLLNGWLFMVLHGSSNDSHELNVLHGFFNIFLFFFAA